jgi:hypothetical protein
VIVASLLAAAVAIALSPLAPFGPVRPVYPDLGVSFDWTVLGLGVVGLIVGLGAMALGLGYREAPHRVGKRRVANSERRSLAVSAAGSAGLPPAAVAGLRFALEPGNGRNAVPVRSAILGAAMAVVVLTTAVTFGASLNALVSQPKLYGWNWDAALVSGGDIPQAQVTKLLGHDPDVAAWSGVYLPDLRIDGQDVAVMGTRVGATVGPPTLSGHSLTKANQVLLGPDTLAQLHKHVGQSVVVSNGVTAPARLSIVGTAAMPAIDSIVGGLHLEMGSGALLSSTLIPPEMRNPFSNPIPGPNAIFIRYTHGVPPSVALRSLNRISTATTNTANFGVQAVTVLRPAEILSYGSLGNTPLYLEHLGGHRIGGRRPAWDRPRAMALGPLRPRHPCRALPQRPSSFARPHRPRWCTARKHRRCHSRAHRLSYADGGSTASRVTRPLLAIRFGLWLGEVEITHIFGDLGAPSS